MGMEERMAFDQEEIQNKDTPMEPVVKSLGTLIREYADSKTAPNLMRQIALGPDMLTEEKQSEQEALIIRFATAAREIYAGMDDSKVGKINVEGIYRMHPLRYVNCREWSARMAASAEKEAAAYRRALEKLNDADAAFLKVVPQIKSGNRARTGQLVSFPAGLGTDRQPSDQSEQLSYGRGKCRTCGRARLEDP